MLIGTTWYYSVLLGTTGYYSVLLGTTEAKCFTAEADSFTTEAASCIASAESRTGEAFLFCRNQFLYYTRRFLYYRGRFLYYMCTSIVQRAIVCLASQEEKPVPAIQKPLDFVAKIGAMTGARCAKLAATCAQYYP